MGASGNNDLVTSMAPKKKADSLEAYRRKRDFRQTPEPSGRAKPARAKKARRKTAPAKKRKRLAFVIQKHQATSLHFDLRLEVDGVLKSWAVPKGLSLDPANKRLAMEVEDHPIEYGEFEGVIPQGEYGGGTVMLWDRGTYFADEAEPGEDDEAAMRRGHEKGKLSFFLEGERLRGSFALVRTDRPPPATHVARGEGRGPKPKWLGIKHRDDYTRADHDPVDEYDTSVVTGRDMDDIAREEGASPLGAESIGPMRPERADALPEGDGWVYEELRDGPRVLAYVTPTAHKLVGADGKSVARAAGIADELGALAERAGRGFVLDGVVTDAPRAGRTYLVSDILYDDGDVVLDEPWHKRRGRLESLFKRRRVPGVRLAEVRRRAGAALEKHARSSRWAGILAKRETSRYRPGERTDDWRRIDIS